MSSSSPAELLVLHAVRIKGMVDASGIARRFPVDRDEADEHLLDYEASGWVQRVEFADVRGWSLTGAGRDENQRLLAAELARTDARDLVTASHAAFVRLNTRFLETITRWQIRPAPWDPLASNDHSDWRWDQRVLDGLASLVRKVRPVEEQLSQCLARFDGYADRLDAALARVDRGQRSWVDEPRIDSCHTVWFELHEDLLATLGLARGAE
jgi:hypothetical protein